MSERLLERERAHNRMIARVVDIDEYLDGVDDKREFTKYEVQRMLNHIIEGGGWI